MTFSTKIVSRLMQWIHVQVAISHDKLSSTKGFIDYNFDQPNFLKASGKHLDNSCHEFPATRKLPNQPVSRFPINRKVRSKTPAAYLALMMRHKKFLDVSSLFPLLGFPRCSPGVPVSPDWFLFRHSVSETPGCAIDWALDSGKWCETRLQRCSREGAVVGAALGTFTSALSALNYIYKYKIIGVVVMLFASASSSSSSSSSSTSSSSSSVLGSKLQLLPHARGWSI